MARRWSFAGPTGIIAKAKVVATSLPAAVVTITAAIWVVLPYLTDLFPGQADTITAWAGRVVTALAGIVVLVRKLTPVPKSQVGVLPPTTPEGNQP